MSARPSAGGDGFPVAPVRAFRRFLGVVGRVELFATSTALLAICALTGAGVFVRYVLNKSIVWSEEVSLFLTCIMVFVGAAAMYKARAYVVLEYFFNKFGAAWQRRLALGAWVLAMAFGTIVCVAAISLYPLQINTTSYILELPRFYWTLPLIWGGASIALTSAYYFLVELAWRDPQSGRSGRESASAPLQGVELSI